MLSIALTGGIASGKSTVLKLLAKSFPTIDSDKIVSNLYKDKKVLAKIEKEFRTKNKKLISEKIFSSKTKRKKLEKILHPLVLKEIKLELAKLKKKKKKIVFVEVPLLFESSFQKFFSHSICVYCTKQQQLQRLKKKGFSRKQALQRIHAQNPLKEKVKYADFVINNNKSLKETKKQVKELIEFIKIEQILELT